MGEAQGNKNRTGPLRHAPPPLPPPAKRGIVLQRGEHGVNVPGDVLDAGGAAGLCAGLVGVAVVLLIGAGITTLMK